MTARLLQLAVWLAAFKWTARALAVAAVLIVFLFSFLLVAELARGLSTGDAFLTAFIATVILIVAPFKWIARGQLPHVDL